MGDAILKMTEDGIFCQFIETIWEDKKPKGFKKFPIYLKISMKTVNSYHYKHALLDHIKTNTYPEKRFKVFFIPNIEDIELKTTQKDGKPYNYHLFEITDLNLFCLFTYSYLKKKK